MAEEYFKRLDEDNDGYLSWDDFRAMRGAGADFVPSSLGFVHDVEYLTWESWKMMIADMGVPIDHLGRVNLSAFIQYRILVEKHKPLAIELQKAKIPLLPPPLVLWAGVKRCLEEIAQELPPQRLRELESKGLPFEEVTYLLSNMNITFTRPEYYLSMAYRAQHENLMESLRLRFLKGTYSATQDSQYTVTLGSGYIPQKAIDLTIDGIKYIKMERLIAWLFSNRPPAEHQSGMYHRMLVKKYNLHRHIRYYDRLCRLAFSIGYQLRLRRVFADFLPIAKYPPNKSVKTNIDFSVSVLGSGGNMESGMGLEWTVQKCDHPEQFLMNHKLPRESGFAVIMELILKPDLDAEQTERMSTEVLHFIKAHFDAELKRNLQFRGIFCFPATSEGDGAPVLRLAICYKRAISVDAWFETMQLPFNLNDLLCGFTGSLKTNIAMSDLFTTSKESSFMLDTQLSARLEINTQLRAVALVEILKRVKLALSASYTAHQTRDDSEDANEVYRRKLREHYPSIVRFCEQWERNLNGLKGTSVNFVFKKLSHMLEKVGAANHWFGQMFPAAIGSSPGFVNAAYTNWTKVFLAEYMDIFQPLSDRMTNTLAAEEENQEEEFRKQRLGLKIEEKKAVRTKTESVVDKLKALGIEMDEDEVTAEDAHDAASLIQNSGERLVKSDQAACVAFENFQSCVLGIHNLQILIGKFKLNCSITGFDLMEFIPKVPSLQKVKKDCEEARKTLKERALARAREERQKRLKAKEEEEARLQKEERKRQREMMEREFG